MQPDGEESLVSAQDAGSSAMQARRASEPTPDPLERAGAFVVELRRLAAGRAAEESSIEAQCQAARNSAEQACAESRLALQQAIELERRDTQADDAEMRQHAQSRYELELGALRREFTERRQQMVEQYSEARRHAKQKRRDARWEAETLYEAGKDLPSQQLQAVKQQLDGLLARGHAERDAAQALLIQWRQPAIEDAPDAESELPEGGDLLSLLDERVNFVTDRRVRLAALRVPPLVTQYALIWYHTLVGLLLAALAWATGAAVWVVAGAIVLSLVLGVIVHICLARRARRQIGAIYAPLARAAREAGRIAKTALEQARARAVAQQTQLVETRDRALSAAEEVYQAWRSEIKGQRETSFQEMTTAYRRHLAEITACRQRDLDLAEQHRSRHEAEIRRLEREEPQLHERLERALAQIQRRSTERRAALADQWRAGLARLERLADEIRGRADSGQADRWVTDWNTIAASGFRPASELPPAVRFGEFRVRIDQIPHGRPTDPQLAERTPQDYCLPACLAFHERPSMLFTASGGARRAAIEAMQAVMLRLLATIPPGKLRFTIVDPVSLGENFAAFMHLADYSEALVTSRIWTEPRHIDERLADLTEHMENVIQKYLRNEYETIDDYNRDAGEIAEPIRYLVIADFPANFSDAAQRRLRSIVANGRRCGVYTMIMLDRTLEGLSGIAVEEIEQHATTLVGRDGRFVWKDKRFGEFELTLDAPPATHQVTEILKTAGRYASEAARIEVPFEAIVPAPEAVWKSSARGGIDVPLGRVGATRLQSLRLGHGTSQHVLVAGKTGSGKSTLWHALVTNLALRYSPDEVELYLVDFKQGVEFKAYAAQRLPHARVVAIESDREFGLSVLGRLDAELRARADRFRALGVQDLAGFREARPDVAQPRILLIVDEFQEFFVEDDKLSQDAALLLDRLVRQGRAFGIHVLLGTQTLAGAYSLARSTIGQMAVRIALQCSETDAHLILSEDNSAARLLSRPGEAIYNDSNGLVEGNHPFQIVWLADDRREEYLQKIRALAEANGHANREQIVFEGHLPADPARNEKLAALLRTECPCESDAPRAWLGEAVAIKEPTSATFGPHSGSNLLVVGQNDDAALGLLGLSIISLSACHPARASKAARFFVFLGGTANSSQSEALARLADVVPGVTLVQRRDVPAAVNELTAEVERRSASAAGEEPPIYIVVYGLHRLRDLRRGEDDFGFSRADQNLPPDPARQFAALLRDGPMVAVHTLVWCDSVNNLQRTWDRPTLREFELRVAFQMNASDSSTLIDTPLAARLGAHRAWFQNEESGVLEKFRPYRWPTDQWLETVARRLRVADGW